MAQPRPLSMCGLQDHCAAPSDRAPWVLPVKNHVTPVSLGSSAHPLHDSASAKSEVLSLAKAPQIPLEQSEGALFHDLEFSPKALAHCPMVLYYNRQNLYLTNSASFILSDFLSAQYVKPLNKCLFNE